MAACIEPQLPQPVREAPLGPSSDEAQRRRADGLGNTSFAPTSHSYRQIIVLWLALAR
jgi:hypothetical protein